MNKITGEKIIVINGERLTMRFTWKALAEIAEKHGDNPNLFKPEIVADIAAAGLRDRHPEYTAERIMDLSPPLVVFAKDVQTAMQWAYFGAEAIPEDDDSVKKNLQKAGLWQRIKTLWNMVFHQSNSGI